jgi:hypothetical protein
MAQLLLQQGKVPDALKYFERAAELSRTEGEIVNALSYAEATRTQLEVCSPRSKGFRVSLNKSRIGTRKIPPTCQPIARDVSARGCLSGYVGALSWSEKRLSGSIGSSARVCVQELFVSKAHINVDGLIKETGDR